MDQAINILIADTQECVNRGVGSLIAACPQMNLVACATNTRDIFLLSSMHRPHVIVTDIMPPLLNGIEGARELASKYPHIHIIAFTSFSNTHIIHQLLQSGVKSCVSKNHDISELEYAILTTATGRRYMCPATQLLIDKHKDCPLTKTERKVLKYIALGKSNEQIGLILGCNGRTVENHRISMKEKLGLASMGELIHYATIRHYHLLHF